MDLKRSMRVARIVAIFSLVLLLGACAPKEEDRGQALVSARAALGQILNAYPNFTSFGAENNYLLFEAPSGVKMVFSRDFSLNEGDPANKAQNMDISLSFFSDEFVAAGTDLNKLCAPTSEDFRVGGDNFPEIVVSWELGADSFKKSDNAAGPIEALLTVFDEIARSQPERFIVDTKRGLYGIDLGRGDSIMWAKRPDKTKKDFIFSFDAAPYLAAGTDLSKLYNFSVFIQRLKKPDGGVVEIKKLERAGDRV